MKCSKCGKEIAEDSMFCEYCGTKIESAASASSEKNIHSKSKTPLWITLAVLLSAIIAGIVVYYQHNAHLAAIDEANQRAEAAEKELERAKYIIAQGYIDLGLPSGTLWKNTNAEGFFTYDEAVSKYGDQLPTKEQYEELLSTCKWSWSKSGGYNIIGVNGNSIYLPANGVRACDYEDGTPGLYWGQGEHGAYRCLDEGLLLEWNTGGGGTSNYLGIGGVANCARANVRLAYTQK